MDPFTTFLIPIIINIVTSPIDPLILLHRFQNNQKPINHDLKKAIKIAYLQALLEITENYKQTTLISSFKLYIPTKIDRKIYQWKKELKRVIKAESEAMIAPPLQTTLELEQLLLSHGQTNTDPIKYLEAGLVNQALQAISDLNPDYQNQIKTNLFPKTYDYFLNQLKNNQKAFTAFELECLPTINASLANIRAGQEQVYLTMECICNRLDMLALIPDIQSNVTEIKKAVKIISEEQRVPEVTVFLLGDNFKSLSSSLGSSELSWLTSLGQDKNIEVSILKAYKNSLPPDASVWGEQKNCVEEMLRHLEEYRKLGKFFSCLSQDETLPEDIRKQLEKFAENLGSKKHPEMDGKEKRKLESYFIATVEHEANKDCVLVNAWLIEDNQALLEHNLASFKPLVDGDECQRGVSCKVDKIEQQLNEFLQKALSSFLLGKSYSLTIEVFLPMDLMCTEVDRWPIVFDPNDNQTRWGVMYPLRLRSQERLKLNYLAIYQTIWYDQWNKIIQILDRQPTLECFQSIEQIDSVNWKKLSQDLGQKIGVKLTCTPPQAKLKYFFNTILSSTTPIAIWTRCDRPDLNPGAIIDEILCSQPLSSLSESVKELRATADAQTDDHLGFHLALLWEDPHRLPPRTQSQEAKK
ncbi:MAG: hypothetical protein ACRCU2_16200 [Planktothrix sp.]